MKVANPVKVLDGQDDAPAQMSQDGLVFGLIMKRKGGLDMLPVPDLGCDASTTEVFRPENQMIQGKQVFCLKKAPYDGVFVAPGVRLPDGVQPILDSAMASAKKHLHPLYVGKQCRVDASWAVPLLVHGIAQQLLRCLDKNQDGLFIAWTDLGVQTCCFETIQEVVELPGCHMIILVWSACPA